MPLVPADVPTTSGRQDKTGKCRQPFLVRARLSVEGFVEDLGCWPGEFPSVNCCPIVNYVEETAPCCDPDGSADSNHCW
jgi:hypothetical protein